jgi:hypothetical protein
MDQAPPARPVASSGSKSTLKSLLRKRSATLDGPGESLVAAASRFETTRKIAENYRAFDELRWSSDTANSLRPPAAELLRELIHGGLLTRSGGSVQATCGDAVRYLTGGWLEEYAGLACHALHADEVRIGQRLRWRAGGFEGSNEVDALARFGDDLLFISCKALKPWFRSSDGKFREKLSDALNEADNLPDHFGGRGSRVCLIVTTDMFDEQNSRARYPQLHGRSSALDVALVSLEDLPWRRFQARLKKILEIIPQG